MRQAARRAPPSRGAHEEGAMTTDTRTPAKPEVGERRAGGETPLATPRAAAWPGTEKSPPPVEEGVSRPPFPTRGDLDTEC
jgi:hypothetical protein